MKILVETQIKINKAPSEEEIRFFGKKYGPVAKLVTLMLRELKNLLSNIGPKGTRMD